MKVMEKLLFVLIVMAVATPVLADDDGRKVSRALRTPIETELYFEGRFVRLIIPANLHDSESRPLPLVLHLHGAVPFPDVPDLELNNSGYRGLPGKYRVMVAAPRGTLRPANSPLDNMSPICDTPHTAATSLLLL
jgi:hypothetical protein